MKDFNEHVSESLEQKSEVVDMLMELDGQAETSLEAELISLIVSLVKMDKITEDSYDSIIDAVDEIIEFETDEMGVDYDEEFDYDDEDEMVDEAQRALYKRRGYVRCPNGKIRKRGKCGKPIDRQKSRKMVRARKKFKRSFAKGARKTKRTKRRLGFQK